MADEPLADTIARLFREGLEIVENPNKAGGENAEVWAISVRNLLGLCLTPGCMEIGVVGYELGQFCLTCED